MDAGRPYAGWTWGFSTIYALRVAMEALEFSYEDWIAEGGPSFIDHLIDIVEANCPNKSAMFPLRAIGEAPGDKPHLLTPIFIVDHSAQVFDICLFPELLPKWQVIVANSVAAPHN